jgi:polysaccharide export outer membrane protein
MRTSRIIAVGSICVLFGGSGLAQTAPGQTSPQAQTQTPPAPRPAPAAAVAAAPAGVTPPSDYVIGPDDQLSIVFWRDKDLTSDVTVRPDGKISLPLLNDVQAAGLTPEQLRARITEDAKRYIEDPTAAVVVRQINSRKVFITGQVNKPGPYPITAPTTVLQLIAMAGGVTDYAKSSEIVVMRVESGKPVSYPFNYKDITKRKNLKQNIELKPGDTVVVP